MESTAQYWRPVWEALERHWQPQPSDARGRRPDVGHPAPGAGAVESGRRAGGRRISLTPNGW